MPATYPSWTPGTPHTDAAAQVQRHRPVNNVDVIEVRGATYRNCQPVTGIFELVDSSRDPQTWRGSLRAEVYCAWHGVKPPTCFPNIKVNVGQFKIIRGYTGDVIDNLAS